MSDAPVLACDGLVCGYPGRRVLDVGNLSFERGTAVVLLGRNGSGKSTLLRTLGREVPPLEGKVLLRGNDLGRYSHSELAGEIAVVPQEEVPSFPFTAFEMVMMGRIASNPSLFDSAEDVVLAEDSMRQADCLHLRDRRVHEISGGERQRVLIARALAQQAGVLLLDEPSSHLDISHQIELMALLRDLVRMGRTIVLAVHDLNLASLVADRIVFVHDGKTLLLGNVEESLASPQIDVVYGVPFDRLKNDQGKLRVFARATD